MKNYKTMKAVNKWSVRKTGDNLELVKKVYNVDTGAGESDIVKGFTLDNVALNIDIIEAKIAELTSEKEDWEQLETDLKAL